jgi:hypothetical protein
MVPKKQLDQYADQLRAAITKRVRALSATVAAGPRRDAMNKHQLDSFEKYVDQMIDKYSRVSKERKS